MVVFNRRVRLLVGYRGHENRFFARGPNWWQVTIPATRNVRRVALIVTNVGVNT